MVDCFVALYDELSSSAAGMPGMPLGKDTDPPILTVEPAGDTVTSAPMVDLTPAQLHIACADNEEEYLGLCYKKCFILSNGTYPKRVAPTGCCKEMSITCILPSEIDTNGIFPGQGYNVGGTGGVPHQPGACDGNEENHLGQCYMKCSLLTDNRMMFRAAANTCCRVQPCWNPFNVKTVGGSCSGYGVGGGNAGHDCPHAPSEAQR
mmetsp:Transcript_38821/g.102602  ORF Transcript_38821/g.102602 Transcript_38821/m.102602 type:complete len:206 (+) Transcript_38821:3-620(+)